MKNYIAALALGVTSINSAHATDYLATNDRCGQLAVSAGANASTYDNDTFRVAQPLYALAGTSYLLKAIDENKLACGSIPSCLLNLVIAPDAQYSFSFDTNLSNTLSIIYSGGNKNFPVTNNSRGHTYVGVAATNDEMSYAICDVADLYWQSAPKIISASSTGGGLSAISVYASASYDNSYSKAAVTGSGVKYTWIFENFDYSNVVETVTTGPVENVTYRPTYNGQYNIYVKISDGVYSDTYLAGNKLYNGGQSGPCIVGRTCQNKN